LGISDPLAEAQKFLIIGLRIIAVENFPLDTITCFKCRFGRLKNFGGLLPPVKDLHRKVLCFAAKVAT